MSGSVRRRPSRRLSGPVLAGSVLVALALAPTSAGAVANGPCACDARSSPSGWTTRVVTRLDHVTTRLDDVASAATVFESLTSLGLVVAWPFGPFGPFSSGGVRLGNVNIEVMGADPAVIPMPSYVTFAPRTVTGLLDQLDRRRVAHGRLQEQVVEGRVLFATVQLDALSSPRFMAQLSEQFVPVGYGPGPVAPPNDAGVVTVRSVVLDVGDRRRPVLQRLLAPSTVGRDTVLASGPALQVRRGRGFGLGALVVEVRDVDRAAAEFAAAGLPVTGSRVTVGTLRLRLVDATG